MGATSWRFKSSYPHHKNKGIALRGALIFCRVGHWLLHRHHAFRFCKAKRKAFGARPACVVESSSPLTRTKTKRTAIAVLFVLVWMLRRGPCRPYCTSLFALFARRQKRMAVLPRKMMPFRHQDILSASAASPQKAFKLLLPAPADSVGTQCSNIVIKNPSLITHRRGSDLSLLTAPQKQPDLRSCIPHIILCLPIFIGILLLVTMDLQLSFVKNNN